uniref:Protein E6 n=1 Tax=Pipistrellus kuhlii papillomavirus TaxID=3140005 RepID=A0AAU6S5C4_9PAPI
MEPALHSIRSLANYLGLDTEELLLTCYYCARWLTVLDKVLFAHTDLGLYEKEGLYYGLCQPCVRSAAKLEFLMYYKTFTSVSAVELQFGGPFESLRVRCWGCFRHLNETEKKNTKQRQSDVAIVGDQPRALCTLCLIGLP